ncbi:MAG: hypothetical protein IKP09_06825 [Lentisphaeria bacterium]|nr:hypothetical protein [Lentisphaeria bacterium]
MIICGIVQSPEKNNDQLVVHQIAGEPQNPNSVIDAQIKLTSSSKCINDNGIKGWRRNRPRELYLQTVTRSSDFLGRPIILGIYLKKEGKESTVVSRESIVELLDKFSLKMDDDSISNVLFFITNRFSKNFIQRISSCALSLTFVVVLIVLTIAFFIFNP